MTLTIEEEQRQMLLLAIAELSLRRPGWLHALGETSEALGGREMFEGFRRTSSDVIQADAKLREENNLLRHAVRNQSGDNLCWLDQPAWTGQILPREEFLESCARYHAQIAGSHGVVPPGSMTIAQLEAECERLREALHKK